MKAPNMTEIVEVGKREQLDAAGVLKLIKEFELGENDDFVTAVGMVAKVKNTFKERDAFRKEQVDSLNKEVEEINGELSPGLAFLAEAETILKDKLGGFVKSQLEKQTKLIGEAGKAAKAGNQKKADALIVKSAELEVPKVPGCAIGKAWKGEVENPSEIPLEYQTPDLKALKALTKAKKLDPKIPGWKAWPEPTVTITVSKVKI